jgi:hypothetical protein
MCSGGVVQSRAKGRPNQRLKLSTRGRSLSAIR